MTCSREFTRRRVRSISAAMSSQLFSISAKRIKSGISSLREMTASSSSKEVNAKPYGKISPLSGLLLTVENTGTSTLIMFLVPTSTPVCCWEDISEESSDFLLMTAPALTKWAVHSAKAASTLLRRRLFSCTNSMNCRISSSRLSLSILWPRLAVMSCFFSLLICIRVGLTFIISIVTPLLICRSIYPAYRP